MEGTRKLVAGSYVIAYWLLADDIAEILHIWHGAEDWGKAIGMPCPIWEDFSQQIQSATDSDSSWAYPQNACLRGGSKAYQKQKKEQ